jgi:leucyl-tRNA synthetase
MLSDTPPERDIEWTEAGAEGAWRFTQRVWRLANDAAGFRGGGDAAASLELRRAAHKALQAVTEDLSALRFNRAIARIYELANALGAALAAGKAEAAAVTEAAEFLILMAAPMMPHLAEESWQAMGKPGHVVDTPWPKPDPGLVADDQVTIAVQVNGKRRDEVTVPRDIDARQVEAIVLKLESVARALEGRTVKKVIVVPGRIANIVG